MNSTIVEGQSLVTQINIFTVEPSNQLQLINTLIEATEQVMRKQPGFISANIHKSLDGKRVANYAQWRTRQDLEAVFRNPDVVPHLEKCKALATYDATLYEVVHVGVKA